MALRLRLAILLLVAGGPALLPASASAAPVEGFTEPLRKIELAPAEAGTIATINVVEGDAVKQQQQVATLDCDVLLITLEMAKAGMEARGRLEAAQAECTLRGERLKKLVELGQQGHATQDEINRARTDFEVAQGNALSVTEQRRLDELEYKKTQAMIERRILRSPINGRVTRIYKEVHEYVAANSPVVMTIVELDKLRIVFSIPTAYALRMRVGQKVSVACSDPDVDAPGEIEAIAPVTEAESGTVRVKVILDNTDGRYRAGVRCTLEIPDLDPLGNYSIPENRP
jgi:RND family efflux transporter MFP subunit